MKHAAQRGVSVRFSSSGWVSWKHAAAVCRAQQAGRTIHTYTDADVVYIKQGRQPRCARAGQTKQPQERAPPPCSQGRAAAAAVPCRARPSSLTKQTVVRAICNLELQNLYVDSASITSRKKTLTLGRSARSLIGRYRTMTWALRNETNPTHRCWPLGDEGKQAKKALLGVSVPPAYPAISDNRPAEQQRPELPCAPNPAAKYLSKYPKQ